MSGQLQRLVLDFRTGELVIRTLYRSSSGLGPGTKARRREAAGLTRTGLTQALEALEQALRYLVSLGEPTVVGEGAEGNDAAA